MPINKMMQAALQAGALGTKIVGSGGGGAMVALATKSTQQQICEAFLSHGVQEAFSVNLTPPDADS
jgi:galactokinase